MKTTGGVRALFLGVLTFMAALPSAAQSEGALELTVTNGAKQLALPLVPGVDQFTVVRSSEVSQPLVPSSSGQISGYQWIEPGTSRSEFFSVLIQPKPASEILAATLMNRLGYGPTPDLIERIKSIGVQAYIAEQLAPETIEEDLAIDRVNSGSDWQFITVTGTASSSSLYIYMSGTGDCYIDDLQIVRGSVPATGANAVPNGDFENGLAGWTVSPNLSNSVVVTDVKHSGNASLRIVSTQAGSTRASSIYREDLGLAANQTYTLSYWYRPGSSRNSSLVLRLSGSGLQSSPGSLATRLALGVGSLNDLTAWHVLHAVQSRKQLLEVMLQFLENHFVTQQSKSREYFDRYYDGDETDVFATNLEYRELNRWRQALLQPQCTFHDLLKISAESPAMIIYLDTVNSRGNGSNIANENYARELLELFTFGVDNGYDQSDIVAMSRAWTGWSIDLVDPENEFNPSARRTTKLRPEGTNQPNGSVTIQNLEGLWAFNYKPANHNTAEKLMFPGRKVPDRFGPPYAGRDYELRLPVGGSLDWQKVTVTGQASSSTLYIYLTGTGECYIDDLTLVPGSVPDAGPNAIINGGFENGLTGWRVSNNLRGSSVSSTVKYSGNGALHLVSTAAGSSSSTSISRTDLALASGQTYTLSFWYKAGAAMTGDLVVRLSGSGIEASPGAGPASIEEGYKVLAHLADQPFTQEYISVKLCRLFVHDDFAHGYDFTDPNLSPEGRLVRACMRAWEENTPKGQIRKVLEVIFNSDLFRGQGASMQKVKTPLEYVVSAVRALRSQAPDGAWTADTDGYSLRSPMNRMGRMRLFDRDTPDGYPESGEAWVSAGTLVERLRFVQSLLLAAGQNGKSEPANVTDPVKLLKASLPPASWRDAGAVAGYFVSVLYPGEGRANLDELRSLAITYLNTADNGLTSSPFASLSDTTANYDTRVRGMVAMLMTSQRFQEQ